MIPAIEQHRDELESLCRRYGVRRLEVFGSAVDEQTFTAPTSDIDFLVEFESPDQPGYADRYFGLLEALEALLGAHVDLVVTAAIRNPYFRTSIERSRALLYAA